MTGLDFHLECMRRLWLLLALVSLSLPKAHASEPVYLNPFSGVFTNLGQSLWGTNLLFYGAAVGSTIIIIETDIDREAQFYFSDNYPFGRDYGDVMLWTGNIFQASVATGMYLGGLYYDNPRLTAGGAAGLQAIGLVGLITVSLKYLTGRVRPGKTKSPRDFRSDFSSWTLLTDRQSWPSGHTSSTIAFFTAMAVFYPEHEWLWYVNGAMTAAMAAGMVSGDYHWTSEVVAGALIGFAVGYTVGKNFRTMYDQTSENPELTKLRSEPKTLVRLSPDINRDQSLLKVSLLF